MVRGICDLMYLIWEALRCSLPEGSSANARTAAGFNGGFSELKSSAQIRSGSMSPNASLPMADGVLPLMRMDLHPRKAPSPMTDKLFPLRWMDLHPSKANPPI